MSARKIIKEYTNNPYIGLFQNPVVRVKKVNKSTQTDTNKALEIGEKVIAAYGDGWESL